MKKNYVSPDMELIVFAEEDIVTTSCGDEDGCSPVCQIVCDADCDLVTCRCYTNL